ncbi:unnamed protein product [Scytosiphon promiscuus]
MRRLLHRKVDPEEQAKEWRRSINHEATLPALQVRALERQILSLERAEKKVQKDIKTMAKEGNRNQKAIRLLAKELVASRNAKNRMYEGKAQLHSVQMQLQNQLALIKVTGVIKKSTEIMAAIGNLVKIPELQENMYQLATEMERAGLVEEIVADGLSLTDAEGLDDQADMEVDKVIAELTDGLLEGAADAPTAVPEAAEAAAAPAAANEEKTNAMKARLESL